MPTNYFGAVYMLIFFVSLIYMVDNFLQFFHRMRGLAGNHMHAEFSVPNLMVVPSVSSGFVMFPKNLVQLIYYCPEPFAYICVNNPTAIHTFGYKSAKLNNGYVHYESLLNLVDGTF